jgi:hypothetical protein
VDFLIALAALVALMLLRLPLAGGGGLWCGGVVGGLIS